MTEIKVRKVILNDEKVKVGNKLNNDMLHRLSDMIKDRAEGLENITIRVDVVEIVK